MIEVKDLSFTYTGGQRPAVRNLDFEIKDGEVFGLLGPNGAGKTTTQNILIGILKGYRGRVSVMGRELNRWGLDYYESIGGSFEFPNHYLKLTARENLEYFRALYSGETEDPADLLSMVGLEEDIDVPVSQFSKGMKNRLNFARSLPASAVVSRRADHRARSREFQEHQKHREETPGAWDYDLSH